MWAQQAESTRQSWQTMQQWLRNNKSVATDKKAVCTAAEPNCRLDAVAAPLW